MNVPGRDNRFSFQNPIIAIKTYCKAYLSSKSPFSLHLSSSAVVLQQGYSYFFCLAVLFRGMLRPLWVCLEIPEELRHRSSQRHTEPGWHLRQHQHLCVCSLQLSHAHAASGTSDGSLVAPVLKE